MGQIIKLTVTTSWSNGEESEQIRHFFTVKDAKRWCERDMGGKSGFDIKWQNASHINPYTFWSPELVVGDGMVTYNIEPAIMTVLDEDDGEV